MKLKNVYLYLCGIALSILLFVSYFAFFKDGKYATEVFALVFAFGGFTIGNIYNFYMQNKNNLLVSLRCYFTSIKNKDVYVSLSYLFRIKVKGENKYLMVKGKKVRHQYQPVGGVYKKFPSSQLMFNKWEAREAKNDKFNSDDLRFYVKGKFIPDVIKWFALRQNRETDVWREFYEELVVTGILSNQNFNFIKPEYLYTRQERLITRRGIDSLQYLIFDIYCIEFDTNQAIEIENLLKTSVFNEKYAFVDEEELDKELFIINGKEFPLGFHARYIKSQS